MKHLIILLSLLLPAWTAHANQIVPPNYIVSGGIDSPGIEGSISAQGLGGVNDHGILYIEYVSTIKFEDGSTATSYNEVGFWGDWDGSVMTATQGKLITYWCESDVASYCDNAVYDTPILFDIVTETIDTTGPHTIQATLFNYGGTGAQLDLVFASPVPLPAGAWLFLSALGGLGVLKRRKK